MFIKNREISRKIGRLGNSGIAIIYLYVDITNAISKLCDLCTDVNFGYFVLHVRDVQCSISKN